MSQAGRLEKRRDMHMRTLSSRWRHLLGGLAVLAALAVFAAGCGSSSSSSSSTSTSGGAETTAEGGSGGSGESSGADIAALEKTVQEHVKPAPIGPTVPIGKPIPKNVTVAFINCGAPACVSFEESFNEAAGVLGWKVENLAAEPTPSSIQSTFSEVVRRKPDAVVTSGFSIEQFPQQAKELNELEIPMMFETGTDQSTYNPAEGVTLQLEDATVVSDAARLMADKAIIDAGGEGEIGAVNLTGYPSVAIQVKAFEEEIEEKCTECSVKSLSVQPTSIGKDAPSIVTNFLRASPGMKGIYFGYAGITVGLGAALKGAGVEPPKVYAWAPDESGIEELKSEEITAAVPLGYHEVAWQLADGIARLQTGGNVKDSQKWQAYTLWSNEFNNLPETAKNPAINPNYKAEFEKLWGLK
jgi:ribose transport system substrate-binding protein